MSASEFDKDQYPMLEVKSELILEAGGEGGSIKLLGTRVPNGWRFRTSTSQGESDWVASWEAALKLLDKYPWHMSPSPTISHAIVHPELRELVLLAVWKRFDLPGSPFSQRLAFGPSRSAGDFVKKAYQFERIPRMGKRISYEEQSALLVWANACLELR